MKNDKGLLWRRVKRYLIIGTLIVAAFLYYRIVRVELHRKSLTAVSLTGVHHIGSNFNIAEFYINGDYESNVGREGFGGEMCCVLLPKKWRPGLVVEVRWAIGDWSKENRQQIEAESYRSISYTCFKAMVPVEKYETAERVYVHFFSGGRVRVVSSTVGVLGSSHPIQRDDPHAADSATVGQRVDAMFTDAEITEMNRKYDNRSTFFGDWR